MTQQTPPLEVLRARVIYKPIPWPRDRVAIFDEPNSRLSEVILDEFFRVISKTLKDKRRIGIPMLSCIPCQQAQEVQKILPQAKVFFADMDDGETSEAVLRQNHPEVFQMIRRAPDGAGLMNEIGRLRFHADAGDSADGDVNNLEHHYLPRLRESMKFVDGLPSPLDDNPNFWREVQQLAFRFRENDQAYVLGFYSQYGALGGPWAMPHTTFSEPWVYVAGWVEWFRRVVAVVDALKNGRPIATDNQEDWHYLPSNVWPEGSAGREVADRHPYNTVEGLERFAKYWRVSLQEAKRFAAKLPQRYLWIPTWMHDGIRTVSPYTIDFPVEPDGSDTPGHAEAWGAVTRAVTYELNSIALTPIVQDFSQSQQPDVLWGFKPNGALQAAFLQWYFKEFAHITMPICGVAECENLVPPNRRTYCSRTCQLREKKRRQRARQQQ